jgi:hypothetical protein
MEKQTAVDWLYINLNECYEHYDNGKYSYTYFVNESKKILEQAKAMEKEQIIQFADKYDAYVVQGGTLTAEQYYNETFNSSTK